METQLPGSHRRNYNAVFRHPVARNLAWRDVRSMLDALSGTVQQEERDGTLKVTRHGRMLILHRPYHKDVADVQELVDLRRSLKQAKTPVPQPRATAAEGAHLLVVIDHRLARIYKAELHGSVPERIIPYDRGGFGRHLHYAQDGLNGQRKPEVRSFYEAVVATLRDAERILLFGSGTGASSAMEQLFAVLKRRHKGLANRVAGRVVVDEQHLSEDQLLAKARDVYARVAVIHDGAATETDD